MLQEISEIKARLAYTGITQEQLALEMGLERSAINRYRRGVRPMPDGMEARMHAALDRLEAAERAADEARRRVLDGEELHHD